MRLEARVVLSSWYAGTQRHGASPASLLAYSYIRAGNRVQDLSWTLTSISYSQSPGFLTGGSGSCRRLLLYIVLLLRAAQPKCWRDALIHLGDGAQLLV